MPVEATYLSAFLVGLLGGVHCAGMCGGIVAAFTLGLPETARAGVRPALPYLLAYNGGRILSYSVAGALVGGLGGLISGLGELHQARLVLQLVAGLFMVALGLYLPGWWRGLSRLEQAGGLLWRRLEPLGRGLLPVRRPAQALALGLLWGWLPCGLVYSVLIWSLTAPGAVEGAGRMLSFGLGTLPTLLAAGVVAARLNRWVRSPRTRAGAGVLVIALGLWLVLNALTSGLLPVLSG